LRFKTLTMSSVTAFAGSVPQNYETYLGPLFFEPYAIDLVEHIQNKNDISTVLEIACGTGRVTKHLASKLSPQTSLVATDLNIDMLKIAQRIVTSKNIQWQVADAHELDFEDNSFDLVICQYGVMFFQDKPKALREVNRVLESGGTFLFNTWNELQYNTLSRLAQNVLEEIYTDDPPRFLEKGPYSFYRTEQIKQLLSEAGFVDISIELVSKTGIASNVDDAVNGIVDGTPNYGYIMERSVPASAVKEKLKALLTDHYGDKNLQLPMQAFVIQAKKD
jgi:ubiquinone/menaquinone biosynthesis C-methylase UbiE